MTDVAYEPLAVLIFVAVSVKLVAAAVPINLTETMQTTMIIANITAYSTAVGPSSSLRNRTSDCITISDGGNSANGRLASRH